MDAPEPRRPTRGWFAVLACVIVGILCLAFAGLMWFALALTWGAAEESSPVADQVLILGVAVLGLTLVFAAATFRLHPRTGRVIALLCLVGGSILFVLLGLHSESFLFYVLLWAPFATLLLMVVLLGPRDHVDGEDAGDGKVEET